MRNTAPIAVVAVMTAAVTWFGLAFTLDSRLDREAQLREQLNAEFVELRREVAALKGIEAGGGEPVEPNPFTQTTPAEEGSRPVSLHPGGADALAGAVDLEQPAAQTWSETRETQWRRLRKWQDNREGPYGKFNVRVNIMTKLLDLDYSQASYYHKLLAEYEGRAGMLYETIKEPDIQDFHQVFEAIQADKHALDADLDETFVQMLTAEQANRYRQLPLEERGVGANAGLSRMQIELSDLRIVPATEDPNTLDQ